MIRNSMMPRGLPLLAAGVLCLGLAATSGAQAAPGNGNGPKKGDNYEHPLGKKQWQLKQKALEAKLKGKAHGRVHEVAKGQYVELEREGEESIFTILTEYGNFPHNNIAEPDRDYDNVTIWREDFSRDHYMDLLFSEAPGAISVRNLYIEMSANRYTVNGDVSEWVSSPGDAEYYDDDNGLAHIGPDNPGYLLAGGTWALIDDSATGWYQAQLDAGMTADEINAYLSQFDVWDRYDHDLDGNFDEPDGYIDHFQIVHSGEGEEAGGGVLGGAALWSHRWYARFTLIGAIGPVSNPLGGVRIGNSDYWIGDYTIEPENGGVGVFAHEYAHDLGLPDLYDISGGENSTGFWTLMSGGSWMSDGTEDIGSKPVHMGAWEKFQLGWLNYEVASAGSKSQHKLGPSMANTKQAQALFVLLPDKFVTSQLGEPYEGEYFYHSGSGNDLNNFLFREYTVEAGDKLEAWVNYDIETDWDYAYVGVSVGGVLTPIATNLSTNDDPNGQNAGHGITGSTGDNWVKLEADLSAFAGQTVDLGFNYVTDAFVANPGMMVDNISVGGEFDGAEGESSWATAGFVKTDGEFTSSHFNAYVAEYRQYRGYDAGLETGPYNFGFLQDETRQNWVERYSNQDGLLITYWDTSQEDNNVSVHPGAGLILPIDAHPEPMPRSDGGMWRPRVQGFDSTFSLDPTDELLLHWMGEENYFPSLPGVSVFDDRNTYWYPEMPGNSVENPNTGTQIRIKSVSAKGGFMQVEVRPAK